MFRWLKLRSERIKVQYRYLSYSSRSEAQKLEKIQIVFQLTDVCIRTNQKSEFVAYHATWKSLLMFIAQVIRISKAHP
jgi:hypothetical protein